MAGNKDQLRYRDENAVKADFESIYVADDPRDYYRVLYGLDYVIPDLARTIFQGVVRAMRSLRGHSPKVLDVGCSYGINAALLKYPLNMDRLAARCRDLDLNGVSTEELIDLDRHYFSSWPGERIEVVGLDSSGPAIDYARSVGLVDHGIAADLENGDLTPHQEALLSDVDLIISTGVVGYVGTSTFNKILNAIEGPRPWIASFVLRMMDYGPIEEKLASFGMVTEKLKGVTFVQRRFHSRQECVGVLDRIEARGLNPEGKEAEGLLHAEFFLSRPKGEQMSLELEQLTSVTSGANLRFGRRFRVTPDHSIRFGH